jgi:hypothetical protein
MFNKIACGQALGTHIPPGMGGILVRSNFDDAVVLNMYRQCAIGFTVTAVGEYNAFHDAISPY